MKTNSSKIKMAILGIAATVVFLAPSDSISAQNASTLPPVTTPAGSPGQGLQYGTSEVVKMFQGGMSKDIIVNYIDNSSHPFHLSADEIINLQKTGVPEDLTKAMLGRDRELQQQNMTPAYQPQQMPPAYPQMPPPAAQYGATSQPPVVTPATPAPDVTVIGGDYAYPYDYGYAYPYYGYYGGWPLYVGGWGWGWNGRGWGWGGGGFHGGFHGGGFGGGFHGGGFGGGFHGGGFGGFHGGGGFGGGHGGGHR